MPRNRLITGALNHVSRPPGNYVTQDYDIPVGVLGVGITLERDNWPVRIGTGATPAEIIRDAEVLRLIVYISFDDGQNWQELARAGMPGGDLTDTDYDADPPVIFPVTESLLIIEFPQPSNPNRQARAEIVVREQLTTSVNVDIVT